MYKIYFNDRPLFLSDRMTDELQVYAHHNDAVLIDEFSPPAVNSMIHEMRQEKVHAGIFLYEDLEALKKAFWKKFTIIQAGGGLVDNGKKEVLFMLRRNKWDLPKGKLDEGETLAECAVREVGEETGLYSVRLGELLLVTYHTYDENGKHILKETYWYRMSVPSNAVTAPQQEEQITELRWVPAAGMGELLDNTFPSILDVLQAGGISSGSPRSAG